MPKLSLDHTPTLELPITVSETAKPSVCAGLIKIKLRKVRTVWELAALEGSVVGDFPKWRRENLLIGQRGWVPDT